MSSRVPQIQLNRAARSIDRLRIEPRFDSGLLPTIKSPVRVSEANRRLPGPALAEEDDLEGSVGHQDLWSARTLTAPRTAEQLANSSDMYCM
jgi:hypothetical protein